MPEIAKLGADHVLKPFGAELDTLAKDALKALDDRAQAMGNRQSSANDVLEWKEGINALRTTTYAELLKIAVDKSLPKSWVESFFRKDSSDVDAEADAATPPEATNP